MAVGRVGLGRGCKFDGVQRTHTSFVLGPLTVARDRDRTSVSCKSTLNIYIYIYKQLYSLSETVVVAPSVVEYWFINEPPRRWMPNSAFGRTDFVAYRLKCMYTYTGWSRLRVTIVNEQWERQTFFGVVSDVFATRNFHRPVYHLPPIWPIKHRLFLFGRVRLYSSLRTRE